MLPSRPFHPDRRSTMIGLGVLATVFPLAANTGTALASSDEAAPLHFLNIQTIRPEARDRFLVAMRHNATESRNEAANIVFDIADPGGDDPTLVLFESWTDRAGYDRHEASAHVAPVLALVPTAFAAPERKYILRDAAGLPAPARAPIADPSRTRNIVVRLQARPDQRDTVVEAMRVNQIASRAAPGNLVYNLYQERADPDAWVIHERWTDVAAHQAHLAQPYSVTFDAQMKAFVAAPPEVLILRDRILD